MGFWESVLDFCENNVPLVAILAVLTIISAILEKSEKIKTPIQTLIRTIKKKKEIKREAILEKERRERQEEENIEFLVENYKSINQSFDEMKKDIQDLKEKYDEQNQMIISNELDRVRYEILDYCNSVKNGRQHSKNEYQHIVSLATKYEELLKKTKQINGVFTVEYEYLQEIYKEKLKNNDFLE